MRLNQINASDGQTGDNPALRALAIAAMTAAAPILNYAEFYTMVGNADKVAKASTAAGGEVRAINSDFSATNTTVAFADATLTILGDMIATDQALERRGYTVTSERARQLEEFCRGMGRFFTDQIVNGDGTSNALTGVKSLMPSGQILKYGGNNGGTVLLGNSDTNKTTQQNFIEALDELISMVSGGATVLICNDKVRARLQSVLREYVTVTTITDAMGQPMQLVSYNGIPLIDAGYKKDGTTKIITNTETLGTSSNACSSVYAVRFGERIDLSIATTNGLNVKDLGLVGNKYNTSVEFDAGTLLQNDKAIAVMQGIKLA